VQLVGGAGLEPRNEVQVEVARLLRLAVHEQAAAADVVADGGDADGGPLQQIGATGFSTG
jgi:hypothetical protein